MQVFLLLCEDKTVRSVETRKQALLSSNLIEIVLSGAQWQILKWLFQGAIEQETETTLRPAATKREDIRDQNAQGKKIIPLKHRRAYRRTRTTKGSKHWCNKNVKIFPFLCTKEIAKSCFYSPVKLKRVGVYNTDRRKHFLCSRKMKREEIARETENTNKVDSAAHVGNKVLPITEERNDQCENSESRDKVKGDKKKTISRMKELLRWAAAAKTEKGGKPSGRKVLRFRRGGTLKAVPDDEEDPSNDSPKISFGWEVESCSTTSSSITAISRTSSSKNGQTQLVTEEANSISCRRKGNWITTDSEFLVLEL